ncbi:MAG: LysR family transcriptional regulator [Eggerthellaceae bacterium]|jgi:LysR family transcriptional activator of glutamate synthase operon
MNLSHLYYFRTLARVQHYTRAAEELFITQPTLSNAVSQLEKELGIPLFQKEGRNVRLTKQGREFDEYITQALDLIDKAVDIAHEQAGSPSGAIDLGVIYTIQADYLPPLLRAYRDRYGSGITINTYQGLTTQLVEDLESGRYDVVFGSYVEGKEDDLGFIPVDSQRLVAVVHDYSPFAKRESVTIEDLSHSKIYSYSPDIPLGKEVRKICRKCCDRDLDIHATAEDEITLGSLVDSDPSAVGLVLDTLGLLPFQNLVKVPLSEVPDDFHKVYLIYRKNVFQPRAVENFINFVREYGNINPEDEL